MPKPHDLRLQTLDTAVMAGMSIEGLETHAREVHQLRRDLTAYTRLLVAAMDAHLTEKNLVRKLSNLSEPELASLDLPVDKAEKIRRVKAERGERPITVITVGAQPRP